MLFSKMKNIILITACASVLISCDGPKEISSHKSDKREHFLNMNFKETIEKKSEFKPTFSPAQSYDWGQSGGSASHFVAPAKLKNGLQSISNLWKVKSGIGASSDNKLVANLVSVAGKIFSMDAQGVVRAHKSSNGSVEWVYNPYDKDTKDTVLGGGLACDGNGLYVATSHGLIIALNLQTGKKIWEYKHNVPLRIAPSVKNNRLYIIDINNQTLALSASSGKSLWSHQGIAESTCFLGGASAAVSDSAVVVSYSSGEVYALSPDNGYVLWSEIIMAPITSAGASQLSHIRGRPIIEGNKVYIASHSGRVVCIDIYSGERLWQNEVGGLRSPAIIGNYIYLVSNSGKLLGINKKDGRVDWTYDLYTTGKNKDLVVWAGPIAIEETLLLSNSNGEGVFISPKENKIVKKIQLPGETLLSPIVSQGQIYFYSENGMVTAWH